MSDRHPFDDDGRHPELDGWEPHDAAPRRPRRTALLRVVVLVAVIALISPGIITTINLGTRNATLACNDRGARALPHASSYEATFEVFGPGGLGWECYAINEFGQRTHVTSMGPIPVAPAVRPAPQAPTQDT